MNTLLIVTTVQAWFFLSLVLSAKKYKQQSDYLLAIWLFIIGLHTLIYYLMHSSGSINIFSAIVNAAIPFLQGPLLYFYVRTKSNPEKRLSWVDALHIIPFTIFILYQLINSNILFEAAGAKSHHVYIGFFENFNVFGIFFIISLPIYLGFCLKESYKAYTRAGNVIWIRLLILFVAGIWCSSLFSLLIPEFMNHQDQIRFNSLVFISLTGLVYFISYFGFKENIFSTDIPKIGGDKYKKSKIIDEEAEIIWANLEEFVQNKQPFLNSELDLNQLARQINTTAHKLSQIINTKSGLSFNDYINQYRVELIKKLMFNDEYKHLSLLGIALEAGFTSKATFNRAFKKFENCTPSEYKNGLTN